jgi:hypothetical protein
MLRATAKSSKVSLARERWSDGNRPGGGLGGIGDGPGNGQPVNHPPLLPKGMSMSASVIWIVVNVQGPVQAFEDRAMAEEFGNQLFDGEGHFRVVSCALVPAVSSPVSRAK